jgi:hypothetical protein
MKLIAKKRFDKAQTRKYNHNRFLFPMIAKGVWDEI